MLVEAAPFGGGLAALAADVAMTDLGAVRVTAAYMLGVSLLVLGLFYWRRGIDRRAAVVCLLLYVPTFALT